MHVTAIAYIAAMLIVVAMVLLALLWLSVALITLGSAEDWTRMQDHFTLLEKPSLTLTPAWVCSMSRHVQYFGDHHLKE